MRPVFDLLETIVQHVAGFLEEYGYQPTLLLVSPASYRRLLELHAVEPMALTPIAGMRVVIDEVLPDTDVELAG
jgi:hypothetical protein